MKRISTIALCLIAALICQAQNYDVRDQVKADRYLAAGCEAPYRYYNDQTAAPKGYKPFYISHYGRHGSRYAWNDGTYKTIQRVLDDAERAGVLTPFGKEFREQFKEFSRLPLINTGDLTALGAQQHYNIAEVMCQQFPEVFSNGGDVLARSTVVPRAITSMASFVASLQKNAPKVKVKTLSLHEDLVVTYPQDAPDELRRKIDRYPLKLDRSSLNYLAERNYNSILSRLFENTDFMMETGGRRKFVSELYLFWSGYHNYCDDDRFESLLTPEEYTDLWEVENFDIYCGHGNSRYQTLTLLEDIIANANAAIEGNGYCAHLRFGHDTVVNAFAPLINLYGCGEQAKKAEDVKYWYQSFQCPMGSNIQFVLYRSKKSSEILFKVLWNNREATLPQLTPVSGPYYKWSDFVEWSKKI